MGNMTNYLESSVANYLFRSGTLTQPSTLAICLITGTVAETITGSLGGFEVATGIGYTRQALNASTTNWNWNGQVSDSGNIDNNSAITFGPATSGWGTVTYVAICDATGYGSGNALYVAALSTPKTVTTDDTLTFSSGNLDIFFG